MKKIALLLFAILFATNSFAAQALLSEKLGAIVPKDKVKINANFTELYGKTVTAFPVTLCYTVGDETTNLTAAANKLTVRAPFSFTLTGVRGSVNTAPVGSTILVDVNKNGTTVLSTKLMINASELTSTTAATPYVISVPAFADDDVISVDLDQVGSSTAGKGLKLCLNGTRAL